VRRAWSCPTPPTFFSLMKTSLFQILSGRCLVVTMAAAIVLTSVVRSADQLTSPNVGDVAPAFVLRTLEDRPIELKQLTAKGPVVLVVLRGWPGYQCPLCTQQVRAFVASAAEFARRGAQVVMVYPGPADRLQARAREFLRDKDWPEEFAFVLDPDYTFTHAYGLRWDAKNETAYPSTFVIGADGKVRFAKVSKTHGGRASVAQALAMLN
jgi:thioredoxin-dependent peroxiredoxin